MLWAWERPEDLTWINTKTTGVAFLARTLILHGDQVTVAARRQPLSLPRNCYLMAVVRLESDQFARPTFSKAQIDYLADQVLIAAGDSRVKAVQIDFDATRSERDAYKQILLRLRRTLPENFPLSITALASWCAADYWLNDLPIDDAVPMFFRMGVLQRNRQDYLAYLTDGSGARYHQRCHCDKSIGLAADELFQSEALTNRRIFLFSPRSWKHNQVVNAVNEIARAQ